MSQVAIITIDGPAGAGKSTLARALAARLGWRYLDTGAMYRAAALAIGQAGLDLDQGPEIAVLLASTQITLDQGPGGLVARLNGRDVSREIRANPVSELASAASALPEVRTAMTGLQRTLGAAGRVVAEGRDMGTVVFPRAAVKFFLTADRRERARRRLLELKEKGQAASLEQLVEEMARRDERDMNRALAPLKPAEDAIHLDTTGLGVAQLAERMAKAAAQRLEAQGISY